MCVCLQAAVLDQPSRGIIPRSVEQIFDTIERQSHLHHRVYCSYLEVYNERIYDLLQYEKSRQVPSEESLWFGV